MRREWQRGSARNEMQKLPAGKFQHRFLLLLDKSPRGSTCGATEGLFRFVICRADHPFPLLRYIGDELAEVGRGTNKRGGPHVPQPPPSHVFTPPPPP